MLRVGSCICLPNLGAAPHMLPRRCLTLPVPQLTARRRAFTSTASACKQAPSVAPLPSARSTAEQEQPPSEVGFAFDIDGVLKLGADVIPATHRALKMIRGENKYHRTLPHIFLTNGGGTTEAKRAELLQRNFGGAIHPDQVILSHSLLKGLDSLRNKDVLLIGPAAAGEIAQTYGFRRIHTPDMLHQYAPSSWIHSSLSPEKRTTSLPDYSQVHFAAVIVLHDNNDWGRSLQYLIDVCRSDQGVFGTVQAGIQGPHSAQEPARQIPLYIAHDDLIFTTDFRVPRLGLGAFRIAAEAIWKVGRMPCLLLFVYL